ncbi:MAG: hypothetical protein P4L46_02525 [Fimbriimonas sp.]|nr:hypothetical protein [Fimbriimonas sp.]
MSIWVLIAIGMLVALLYVAALLARGGTIYFRSRYGYQAFSGRKKKPRDANRDQFRKVIERLLVGDIYDMLWVSWTDDVYTGVMLTLVEGAPELSLSFKAHTETAELASFKVAMGHLGYAHQEDSDSFNGGFAEENRITSLEYMLPVSVDAIVQATNIALTSLHGAPPQTYYMTGSLFAHGPGLGTGIKFSPSEDPLCAILGDPAPADTPKRG